MNMQNKRSLTKAFEEQAINTLDFILQSQDPSYINNNNNNVQSICDIFSTSPRRLQANNPLLTSLSYPTSSFGESMNCNNTTINVSMNKLLELSNIPPNITYCRNMISMIDKFKNTHVQLDDMDLYNNSLKLFVLLVNQVILSTVHQ